MVREPSGLDLFAEEDPYEFPSDESLTDMSVEEQIAAMCEWFHWNFEDPANTTPYESREGGYIYIWGGPYDALDELSNRFDGIVNEGVIASAVNEVQSDGLFDWAPSDRRIREEIVDEDEEESNVYDEATIREHVLQTLTQLEEAANQLEPTKSLIGHNNPPEPLIDVPYSAEDEQTIKQIIGDTRKQLNVEEGPNVENLKSHHEFLSELCGKIGAWISQKADLAVDEAAKSFGTTIGNLSAKGVVVAMGAAIYHFWASLEAATAAIGKWTEYILMVLGA